MARQSDETRTELLTALKEARACSDALFSLVRPDSFYERPVPERHRIVFYLGHLEAFDWNQVSQSELQMESFHPEFDQRFAFGIDPPSNQLPHDDASEWPSLKEIHRYNRGVRERLDAVFSHVSEPFLHVALEHRLMHLETLSYILHQLPRDRKTRSVSTDSREEPSTAHSMMDIPAGYAALGKKENQGFGWDNEFRLNELFVPSFSISKYKVTNRQYLEFVQDGGNPPFYWVSRKGRWFYRTMFDEVPLPLEWPVYVTHEEASAYARWVGKSLPTEAQYHRAAYGTKTEHERPYPWGDASPMDMGLGRFDFSRWDPIPVSAAPQWDSAFGVSQLIGNGWEWTSTCFHSFPGFEPFSFYPGYSARFFDEAHYVLKGGSFLTAGRLLRRSFRNWFRANFPYAYTGFRCVDN